MRRVVPATSGEGKQEGPRVWDKGSRSSHSLSHPDSPFPTNTADVTSRENVLFLFVIYDFHLKKRQFVCFFFLIFNLPFYI